MKKWKGEGVLWWSVLFFWMQGTRSLKRVFRPWKICFCRESSFITGNTCTVRKCAAIKEMCLSFPLHWSCFFERFVRCIYAKQMTLSHLLVSSVASLYSTLTFDGSSFCLELPAFWFCCRERACDTGSWSCNLACQKLQKAPHCFSQLETENVLSTVYACADSLYSIEVRPVKESQVSGKVASQNHSPPCVYQGYVRLSSLLIMSRLTLNELGSSWSLC